MRKIEYKVTYYDESTHVNDIQEAINWLARDGWELVCVDNGVHYFERKIEGISDDR